MYYSIVRQSNKTCGRRRRTFQRQTMIIVLIPSNMVLITTNSGERRILNMYRSMLSVREKAHEYDTALDCGSAKR